MNYKIKFKDGVCVEDLARHGISLISTVDVSQDVYEKVGEVGEVVIEGPADDRDLVGEHRHMQLVDITHHDKDEGIPEGWYITLLDIPKAAVREIEINARLDYIEMMEGL